MCVCVFFFPVCTQRWGVSACGGQVQQQRCCSLCLPDVCVPNLLLIWQSCVGATAASPLTVVPHTHAHTHKPAPPPLPFVWHTSSAPLRSWPLKKEPFQPLKVNVYEEKKNFIKMNACNFVFSCIVCVYKNLRLITSLMTMGTRQPTNAGDYYLF